MYFFVEADEFNKHFLLLDPSISLITKVDHDHKDIYPTQKSYFETFELFINKTKKEIFTNDIDLENNLNSQILNKKIEYIPVNKNIKFKYIFGEHMLKNASLVVKLFNYL
jgi:UDP-N-acetylmuramate-alanine ligase